MKKTAAFILAFTMLFLCACSGSPDSPATPSDAQSASEEPVKDGRSPVITEWGVSVLPEAFPAPPEGTHDFSIAKGLAEKAAFAYSTDFYRITFICPEIGIYTFSNELIALGYTGGIKKFTDASYYSDGYSGYWQNGEKYIRIQESTAIDNGEMIFVIDIADCVDNFSDKLAEIFPKFNGYCMSIGSYCAHDGNGDRITTEFDGSFAAPSWHWEFRFANGFVGVEQLDFEKYFYSFEAEGYKGVMLMDTIDGCRVITSDLIKSATEGDYGVFMIYNMDLKTLDIAYTNDASIYTEQNQH
ncbi:MAG: hypothetical protein IJD78_09935 [Clostridia bacterium]|nr:hypothetical protein [Clostridia bacterium]